MQVYSLSCANCRLHSKYSQNIAIIFQFIFCEKKKEQILFTVCSLYILFDYCREVLEPYFLQRVSVMEKSGKTHIIYFIKFCGHPVLSLNFQNYDMLYCNNLVNSYQILR